MGSGVDLLDELSEAQREAVTHPGGPALVVAGAGSGKTRVLTRRVAYLIRDRGISPFCILAITFTNKAAREMKERCEELIGDTVRNMWVGTFHSTCVRMLRRFADRVGYRSDFCIYDRSEQRELVKGIFKELGIDEKRVDPGAVLNAIGRAKNRLQGPDALEGDRGPTSPFNRDVARVYRRYQDELRACNTMDFDDLLAMAARLLNDHPDVLQHYQQKFQYILVDEYQDTNHAQYRLVRLLGEKHRNVFVVGDSDQSIYGWRGADIGNILSFEADYPETTVYRMEQNYRSTQPILLAAQRVIGRNLRRQSKRLWTRRAGDAPVCFYRADSGEMEAQFVLTYAEQLVRDGERSWSDFGILYRTNAQTRLFEEACVRRGVPYQILAGTKFYDRLEIRDAVAFLRVLVNEHDWVSLRRIINRPSRGIGPTTLQRLEDFAAKEDLDIHSALAGASHIPGLRRPQRRALQAFWQAVEKVLDGMDSSEPAEILGAILEESGYVHHLREQGDRGRQENLDELVASAMGFAADLRSGRVPVAATIPDHGGQALSAFLSEVALVSDVDDYEGEADRITLLTVHSAKGLEFPCVFMVGMEEELFPHARSMGDPDQLEEERRLCYVGMTRAQDRLILTCARSRSLYGGFPAPAQPSRFLREIGEEQLLPMQPGEGSSGVGASSGWPGGQTAPVNDRTPARKGVELSPGDRVRHGVWGEGTIVGRRKVGGDVELTIAFADQGLKTVVADMAPLERISSTG